jgi:SET domain
MEELLDQADAMVRAATTDDYLPRPDFFIPDEYNNALAVRSEVLVLRDDGRGGRGWFAANDLAAGTLLLVAKPLALVMDWQDDEDDEDFETTRGNGNTNEQHNDGDNIDEDAEDDADGDDDDDDEDAEDGMLEEDKEDNKEPRVNELLLLEMLGRLSQEPSLWKEKLSTLFPRTEADVAKLPVWVCHNDDVFMQVETLLATMEREHAANPNRHEIDLPIKEISKRLPLILRYNILSVETCAELLSYPGPDGHAALAGVGLYCEPSFFNHSPRPNVSRWCVGDVMGFTTNQVVSAGIELCISYLEHDVLCEPAWRRNRMLAMDFVDVDSSNDDDGHLPHATTLEEGMAPGHAGPDMPVVDSDVQNELMSMDPFARLMAIDELLAQAMGIKQPSDAVVTNNEDSMEQHDSTSSATMETASTMPLTVDGTLPGDGGNGGGGSDVTPWFQCDVHNLRILKAITLDGLGQTSQALALWEESVRFVEQRLPPLDESSIVLRVQAALCAWHLAGGTVTDAARDHATVACQTHATLFGGSTAQFRRRLGRDLQLALRPTLQSAAPNSSAVDELWPL